MSHYMDDDTVHVATVGIYSRKGGYFVRVPHGTSGGYQQIGPMRLAAAVVVAKGALDSHVKIHKQLLEAA